MPHRLFPTRYVLALMVVLLWGAAHGSSESILLQSLQLADCPEEMGVAPAWLLGQELGESARQDAWLAHGLQHLDVGDTATAVRAFHQAAKTPGGLEFYARLLEAQALAAHGMLEESTNLAKALLDDAPRGLIVDVAEAATLAGITNPAKVYGPLRARKAWRRQKSFLRELRVEEAKAWKRNGRLEKALDLHWQVLSEAPKTLAAFESFREWHLLAAAKGKDPLGLPTSSLSALAQCAFARGNFELARNYYGAIAERADSPQAAFDARYEIGMTYYRADEFDPAAKVFEELMTDEPNDRRRASALFRLGHAYRNAGRPLDAMALYERFGCTDAQEDHCARPMISKAYVNMYLGNFAEARLQFDDYLRREKRSALNDDASFYRAMIALATISPEEGLLQLARFLAEHSKSNYAQEARYWRLRTLDGQDRCDEVIDEARAFLALEPASIYAPEVRRMLERALDVTDTIDTSEPLRVLERDFNAALSAEEWPEAVNLYITLRDTLPTEGLVASFSEQLRSHFEGQPLAVATSASLLLPWMPDTDLWIRSDHEWENILRSAKRLALLGLEDWADVELERFLGSRPWTRGYIEALPFAASMENQTRYRTICRRLRFRLFGKLETYDFSPLAQRLTYPTAYRELVIDTARRYELPPGLLWSVMYHESRFNSAALSPASARGVAQFIPSTGRKVAKQLGNASFDLDRLHNPHVAIPMMGQYLGDLVRQFEGRVHCAVAGYNGGPHSVRLWEVPAGLLPLETEALLPFVAFEETRNYTRKVMRVMEIYENLEEMNHR